MRENLSSVFALPAPVGGLNLRDSLASMPPLDCYLLDNMLVKSGAVGLRKGYTRHSTDMSGATVETLAGYAGTTSDKMIACAGGEIYDVTADPAVSLASGLTNNYWSTTLINNILLFFNGIDTPRQYNGTAVSNAVYTGVGLTATKLCHVNRYRSRLYMVEESSLKMWYSDVTSVTGALTEFDFSRIFTKGGKLLWTATWTRDGGNGMDDLFVAATNKGEIVVYSGSYPADSSWAIVGRFDVPEIIGRRSYCQIGGELMVLTAAGLYPLSRLLQTGGAGAIVGVLADKVNPAFPDLARSYGSTLGWDVRIHPLTGVLYINVPISSEKSIQYVCATANGSWSRYRGIDARSWAVYNGALYFGGANGIVYKTDSGNSDDDAPIQFAVGQSYNAFSTPLLKHFNGIRPIVTIQGTIDVNMTVRTDFSVSIPENEIVISSGQGSAWNDSPWDSSPWSVTKTIAEMSDCGTLGRFGSVCMQGQASAAGFDWMATDVLIEPSGGII